MKKRKTPFLCANYTKMTFQTMEMNKNATKMNYFSKNG